MSGGGGRSKAQFVVLQFVVLVSEDGGEGSGLLQVLVLPDLPCCFGLFEGQCPETKDAALC